MLHKLSYSNKITRKLELVVSCLGWKFPKKQTLIDNTETKLSMSTAVVKVTDVPAGCAHIGIVAQSKRRWKYLFLWSFFNTLLLYVWKNTYFSLMMLTDQIFLLFTFWAFLKRGAIGLKIKLVFHGIHIQYSRREYASGEAKSILDVLHNDTKQISRKASVVKVQFQKIYGTIVPLNSSQLCV